MTLKWFFHVYNNWTGSICTLILTILSIHSSGKLSLMSSICLIFGLVSDEAHNQWHYYQICSKYQKKMIEQCKRIGKQKYHFWYLICRSKECKRLGKGTYILSKKIIFIN